MFVIFLLFSDTFELTGFGFAAAINLQHQVLFHFLPFGFSHLLILPTSVFPVLSLRQ